MFCDVPECSMFLVLSTATCHFIVSTGRLAVVSTRHLVISSSRHGIRLLAAILNTEKTLGQKQKLRKPRYPRTVLASSPAKWTS